VFDYHHSLPRLAKDGSAGMGSLLLLPIQFFLLWTVDRARDPGFSAALVACPLPPGAKTVELKRELRPWVVEFGTDGRSSVRRAATCRSPICSAQSSV